MSPFPTGCSDSRPAAAWSSPTWRGLSRTIRGFARWRRVWHWQTAYSPAELSGVLAGGGLTVLADLGADEHRSRLAGRDLLVVDGERIAIAAVPATG